MNDINSLPHPKRKRQHHTAFVPIYRGQEIYGKNQGGNREDAEEIVRASAPASRPGLPFMQDFVHSCKTYCFEPKFLLWYTWNITPGQPGQEGIGKGGTPLVS